MFERLFNALRTFFRKSSPIPEAFDSLAVDKQIKADLASAAEEGMVTTRLQDHTLPSNRSTPKNLEAATLKIVSRKIESSGDVHTMHKHSSAKRKRSSSKLDTIVTDPTTIVASEPEVFKVDAPTEMALEMKESDLRDIGVNGAEPGKQLEKVANETILESQKIPKSVTAGSGPNLSNNPELSMSNEVSKRINDGEHVMNSRGIDLANEMGSRKQERSSKRQKVVPKLGKTKTMTAKAGHANGIGQAENAVATEAPTHKRFGSEEPEIIELTPTTQAQEVNANLSGLHQASVIDESEDEAPEAVTATAGLEQSRNAATEVAKAIERQEKATKAKRQTRDARLKEQSQLAKKGRRRHRDVSPGNQSDTLMTEPTNIPFSSHTSTRGTRLGINRPLPFRLPDEILAAEPVARLPPPPPDTLTSKPQKHRFLEREPRHPKDVKHGSIRIRVLRDNNITLPPRVSIPSKSLRESWLYGQRGRRGEMELERRKAWGGFVRKRADKMSS